MKSNYTHIAILLDRSGSMTSIQKDVINGLDLFIEEQRKLEGECTVSLMQFDNVTEYLNEFEAMASFKFDKTKFMPRGSTALVDSMVKLIKDTGAKLASMNEEDRPEKVLFIVVTDGEENSSVEYSSEQLKELVEEHENVWKWSFSYIGANQDAFSVAGRYGISSSKVVNYTATSGGTGNAFATLSKMSSRARGMSTVDYMAKGATFTEEEQEAGNSVK